MAKSTTFLELFSAPAPAMLFREPVDPDGEAICHSVQNRLHGPPAKADLAILNGTYRRGYLDELLDFYLVHDGAELGIYDPPIAGVVEPLLNLNPVRNWQTLTARLEPGGDLSWIIDSNSNRNVQSMYRAGQRLVAFATFEGGPGCLITFEDGAHAGKIFFLTPEPSFNIAKPLCPSFDVLCAQIGKDFAAVLRRCGVTSPEGVRPWKFLSDKGLHTGPAGW